MDLAERLANTDALTTLDDAYGAAWNATDQRLLTICRDRVAMLLRHRPTIEAMSPAVYADLTNWTTSDRFSACDRTALGFTEQYVIDVASLTDAQSAALRDHLGDEGFVNFVTALLVVEQRMTLQLAFERVL